MSYVLKNIITYDKERNSFELQEVYLFPGKGISGDRHYDEEANQISVLFVESPDMDADYMQIIESKDNYGKGLCHIRHKANLYIICDQHPDLAVDREFTIGDKVLRISKTKPCFDECVLHQNGDDCYLKANACFAEVITGGNIETDDPVSC